MKNSSMLFEQMLRNFTRSSSGTNGFSASPRTRRLNSSQLSSRSKSGRRELSAGAAASVVDRTVSAIAVAGVGRAEAASGVIDDMNGRYYSPACVARNSEWGASAPFLQQNRVRSEPHAVAAPRHPIINVWNELRSELQHVEQRYEHEIAQSQIGVRRVCKQGNLRDAKNDDCDRERECREWRDEQCDRQWIDEKFGAV